MSSNTSYDTNYELFVSMLAEIVISYITKNPLEGKDIKAHEEKKGGEE